MQTSIQKWGNSQAVRLPKPLLDAVSLGENDRVELSVENDCIIIRPASNRHRTLKERLADYHGHYECSEWDTGGPEGNEAW